MLASAEDAALDFVRQKRPLHRKDGYPLSGREHYLDFAWRGLKRLLEADEIPHPAALK